MARNEEKHYGRLNRMFLLKEKEEYEKKNPDRPRLDSLHTVEEVQKWLPSIKRELEFYLCKSQKDSFKILEGDNFVIFEVTCYSDEHIEECRMKVVKLEKEFKAFVRKIKQLSSGTLDAIPWTNRAYKRKNNDPVETKAKKEFVPISCPILEQTIPVTDTSIFIPNIPIMDEPLCFNVQLNQKESNEDSRSESEIVNLNDNQPISKTDLTQHKLVEQKSAPNNSFTNLVNYDSSSDSDYS